MRSIFVMARAGRIDEDVNDAGHAITGAVEDTTIAEARAQLETNFFGVAPRLSPRAADPGSC